MQREEEPHILFLSETKLDRKGMQKFKMLNMPYIEVMYCVGGSGALLCSGKKMFR
jgi:hypothetical protein